MVFQCIPRLGYNKPVIQIIQDANSTLPERGKRCMDTLRKSPRGQRQAEWENFELISSVLERESLKASVTRGYLDVKIGVF